MCEPSLYLCWAGGNLSPCHLVLQAGNLLLQVTDCPLLLCCLCSQLRLQCELTSSNNSIKQAKLQRPLAVGTRPCKTRSVMLLQYIHGKTHKGTLQVAAQATPPAVPMTKCCQDTTRAVPVQFLFSSLFLFFINTTMHKMLHTQRPTL